MVASLPSILVIVLVCSEVIEARMLKKHELKVPEFLAEATTEMSETTEMPDPDKPIEPEVHECGENEEFGCHTRCDMYCFIHREVDCKLEPCYSHCACKEGYARNHEEKCIPMQECLLEPCSDPNQVRKLYGLNTKCHPTCQEQNLAERCNEFTEHVNVTFPCECKEGYILTHEYGECVPIQECERIHVVIFESRNGSRIATNMDSSTNSATTGVGLSNESGSPATKSNSVEIPQDAENME
ncbi:hypothetical protein ANCCAN_03876 [Ancylostoma caninum]|uniref:TIL domain-containing protein n=1 Tax=Ancylostoma caninum TaxID=29170 RepID=A0A368H0C1_ANCCA|nr:hypothetical protein ANCCAN_03876 [Ancylostoma caninum]